MTSPTTATSAAATASFKSNGLTRSRWDPPHHQRSPYPGIPRCGGDRPHLYRGPRRCGDFSRGTSTNSSGCMMIAMLRSMDCAPPPAAHPSDCGARCATLLASSGHPWPPGYPKGLRGRPARLPRLRRHHEGYRLHRPATTCRRREDPSSLRPVGRAV